MADAVMFAAGGSAAAAGTSGCCCGAGGGTDPGTECGCNAAGVKGWLFTIRGVDAIIAAGLAANARDPAFAPANSGLGLDGTYAATSTPVDPCSADALVLYFPHPDDPTSQAYKRVELRFRYGNTPYPRRLLQLQFSFDVTTQPAGVATMNFVGGSRTYSAVVVCPNDGSPVPIGCGCCEAKTFTTDPFVVQFAGSGPAFTSSGPVTLTAVPDCSPVPDPGGGGEFSGEFDGDM